MLALRRRFGTAGGARLGSARLLSSVVVHQRGHQQQQAIVSGGTAQLGLASRGCTQRRGYCTVAGTVDVGIETAVDTPTPAGGEEEAVTPTPTPELSSIWPEVLSQLQGFYTAASHAAALSAAAAVAAAAGPAGSSAITPAVAPVAPSSTDTTPAQCPPDVAAQAREYVMKTDGEHAMSLSDAEGRATLSHGLSVSLAIELAHFFLYFSINLRKSPIALLVLNYLAEHTTEIGAQTVLEICTSATRLRYPQGWYAVLSRDIFLPLCLGIANSFNWPELMQFDTLLKQLQENDSRARQIPEMAVVLLGKQTSPTERIARVIKSIPQLGANASQLISSIIPDCGPAGYTQLIEAMAKHRELRQGHSTLVAEIVVRMCDATLVPQWDALTLARFLSFLSALSKSLPETFSKALLEYLSKKSSQLKKQEVSLLLEALAVAGLADSQHPYMAHLCNEQTTATLCSTCDLHEKASLLRAMAVTNRADTAKALAASFTEADVKLFTPADIKNLLHGCVYMSHYPNPLMQWVATQVLVVRQNCNLDEASAIVYGLSQAKEIPRGIFTAMAQRVSTIVKFSARRSSAGPSSNEHLSAHCIAMLLRGFEAVHLSAATDPKLFQYLGDHIAREAACDEISFTVRDCASLLLVVHNLHLRNHDFAGTLTSQIRNGVPNLSVDDVVFVADCLSHAEVRDFRLGLALGARLVALRELCTEDAASKFIHLLLRDKLFNVFEQAEMHLLHQSVRFTGKNAALMASCCAQVDQPQAAEELALRALEAPGSWETPDTLVNILRAVPVDSDTALKIVLELRQKISNVEPTQLGPILVAAAGVRIHAEKGWSKEIKLAFLTELSNHAIGFSIDPKTGLPAANGSPVSFETDAIATSLKFIAADNLKVVPLFRLLGKHIVDKGASLSPTQTLTILGAYTTFQIRDDRVIRLLFQRCNEMGIAIAKNPDQKVIVLAALKVFGEAWANKDFVKKLVAQPKAKKGAKK